jgi:hypothetical protein
VSRFPQLKIAKRALRPVAFCVAAFLFASGSETASADNINGTGWKGTASSNWSNTGNWDSDSPNTSGSGDRNLFFGQGYKNAGGGGSLTANNDLTSWAGYRITFQNIDNTGNGTNDKSFIITGNSFTLFDFGSGNFPRIENDSFVNQTFTLTSGNTITLSGGSNNKAEIDPVNGNLVFSAGTKIDLAGKRSPLTASFRAVETAATTVLSSNQERRSFTELSTPTMETPLLITAPCRLLRAAGSPAQAQSVSATQLAEVEMLRSLLPA